MRNDLKAVEGVTDVETDVDEKTVQFRVTSDIDVQTMLDELVESNDKLKDWEIMK